MRKEFSLNHPLVLERGDTLENVSITYHTWGKLNAKKDNVVWVFHALTANSDCMDWWNGLLVKEELFDLDKYFIVCANILGSCYGTTGPTNLNFPLITIRDMVNCHEALVQHLNIKKIKFALGGSMGGYQALEWNVNHPELFENLILIATSPKESPWGIAIHEAHRQALKNDPTWGDENGGKNGLKTARAFGMIQYRNYEGYEITQAESDDDKLDDFKASSYIEYQGDKFVKRFNPYSYFTLLNAMDTHNLGRKRGGIPKALEKVTAHTLVIGIDSDILCPIQEQKLIAKHIKMSTFKSLESSYGHDGFLVEHRKIAQLITTKFNV